MGVSLIHQRRWRVGGARVNVFSVGGWDRPGLVTCSILLSAEFFKSRIKYQGSETETNQVAGGNAREQFILRSPLGVIDFTFRHIKYSLQKSQQS